VVARKQAWAPCSEAEAADLCPPIWEHLSVKLHILCHWFSRPRHGTPPLWSLLGSSRCSEERSTSYFV